MVIAHGIWVAWKTQSWVRPGGFNVASPQGHPTSRSTWGWLHWAAQRWRRWVPNVAMAWAVSTSSHWWLGTISRFWGLFFGFLWQCWGQNHEEYQNFSGLIIIVSISMAILGYFPSWMRPCLEGFLTKIGFKAFRPKNYVDYIISHVLKISSLKSYKSHPLSRPSLSLLQATVFSLQTRSWWIPVSKCLFSFHSKPLCSESYVATPRQTWTWKNWRRCWRNALPWRSSSLPVPSPRSRRSRWSPKGRVPWRWKNDLARKPEKTLRNGGF